MAVPSRLASASAVLVLTALLAGCVPSGDAPPAEDPQGPLPPSSGPITLERLATIVSEADAPSFATFDVGAASTSGADLLSEQDYWIAVGGSPEQCADVVSSPYLVSSHDATDVARIDDPTGTLGTFTEAEDLFGLIQIYGRVFDDRPTASRFLDELMLTVAGCRGYQFTGPEGVVTYAASDLRIEEDPDAPIGTRVVRYVESVSSTDTTSVGITFAQHGTAVVAVYAELYPSSTMTPADATAVADAVTARLAAL